MDLNNFKFLITEQPDVIIKIEDINSKIDIASEFLFDDDDNDNDNDNDKNKNKNEEQEAEMIISIVTFNIEFTINFTSTFRFIYKKYVLNDIKNDIVSEITQIHRHRHPRGHLLRCRTVEDPPVQPGPPPRHRGRSAANPWRCGARAPRPPARASTPRRV